MAKAWAKVSLSDIERKAEEWAKVASGIKTHKKVGKWSTPNFSASLTPGIKAVKAGILLTGLIYTYKGSENNVHITITPGLHGADKTSGAKDGDWRYLHLTIEGSNGCSMYLELVTDYDDELTVKRSSHSGFGDEGAMKVTKASATESSIGGDVIQCLTAVVNALVKKDYGYQLIDTSDD
jgi:hypothetical protein